MYIYDRKNDSINRYTIEAKKEELKKYKQKIIEANDEDLLYYLITSVETTKDRFVNSEELSISDIVFGPQWTIPGKIQSNLRNRGGTKNIAYLRELCLRFHGIGWEDLEDECIEHINLIVAVEKEFGIKFNMNEVTSMKNVGEMVAIIEERVG